MKTTPSLPTQTSWSSFRALNICQFIGSMNDNLYKLLLVYCFIHIGGAKESNRILALAGGLYVLPFLFLATIAGTLADRYSKRTIIIATRLVEVVALLIGLIALGIANKFLAYFVLVLLACHSSLFAPSKYGIVPEIVAKKDISKANGLLTLFTYTAIIIGTFLGSFLTEYSHYNFVVASIFPIVFSSLALFMAFKIHKTAPSGSQKKVSGKLIHELIANIRIIRKQPSLLSAVFGSAFFLFVGSFIQLNIIPYALECLHLSDVQGGYMFLLVALGIGLGSFLAGKISGKSVEFGLIPIGSFGLALSFFFLWLFSSSLPIVLILFSLIGIFGGFYLIPLDSYIQVASPPTARGQVVATSNFFGFLGVFLAALLLYCTAELLDLSPDTAFLLIGILVLFISLVLLIPFAEYIARFYSFLLSACLFPTVLKGKEKLSLDHPSFFFAPLAFSAWMPALLGAQRHRIAIFKVSSNHPPRFVKKLLRKLLSFSHVDEIHDLYPDGKQAHLVKKALEKNFSIAFLASTHTLSAHAEHLKDEWKKVYPEKTLPFAQISPVEPNEDPKAKFVLLTF